MYYIMYPMAEHTGAKWENDFYIIAISFTQCCTGEFLTSVLAVATAAAGQVAFAHWRIYPHEVT